MLLYAGTVFPISPVVSRLVPGLFALNERVVLSGEWAHGSFSYTAVGAYNVGSMSFNFDSQVTRIPTLTLTLTLTLRVVCSVRNP